jgi:hypothetical protein
LLAQSPQSSNPAQRTFTGEIMDSICAPSKSHTAMMSKNSTMGHDKATCTKQCARLGGKYVLYDSSNGTVYSLDDPGKVESLAGRKVRISGTLAGNNLQVANVSALG